MVRKYKSLICLFVFLIVLFPIRVDAFESNNIKDYSDYLSESEVAELQNKVDEIANKYTLDTLVIITDNTDGKSLVTYANDFYIDNNYGLGERKSGILMVINTNDNKLYIQSKGNAIFTLTYLTRKNIEISVSKLLSDNDYYGASNTFLDNVNHYCEKESSSNNSVSPPDSNTDSTSNTDINSSTEVESVESIPDSFSTKFKNIVTSPTIYVVSLIVSLLVTLTVTAGSKWKVTVNGRTYGGDTSFNLTNKLDTLVSENTTKTELKKKS